MKHNRQFLICKQQLAKPNFDFVELGKGFYLNYHTNLSIKLSQCGDNILLGLAFKSISGNIKDDLNKVNHSNVSLMTSDWSGRWLLIIKGNLYLDASGMLGCYYGQCDKGLVVSSSLSLIAEHYDFKPRTDYQKISYGNSMNWFPPPLTIFHGVRKLLIGHYLSIEEMKVHPVIVRKSDFSQLNQDEIYAELASRLKEIIANISSDFGKEVYLPLTGGYDSRTLLSAFLVQQLPFTAFLFGHDNLSFADATIPRQLADKHDFPLFFIDRVAGFNQEKYQQYIEHSAGQAADAGVLFYANGQYEPLVKKSKVAKKIIIRGGVWEVGRKKYTTSGINESLSCETDILANLAQSFPIIKQSNLHKQSIEQWVSHTKNTYSVLGFRDRFYLEQRISGWLSSLEQAADITDFERIHPANCQDIIELLSLAQRHPQPEIIARLKPELLETPFNPRALVELPYRLYNFLRRRYQQIRNGCSNR
ncbi:hypothetical protein [Thalassotalea ganghwensis]